MSLEALAAKVRLVVFDVDGVMTNGQLILGPAGEELKVFHVRDGHGLVMLRQSGLAVAVITGRQSAVVAARNGGGRSRLAHKMRQRFVGVEGAPAATLRARHRRGRLRHKRCETIVGGRTFFSKRHWVRKFTIVFFC